MALRIRIEHGQDAGRTFRLAVDGLYRFGRSPQSSMQVLDMKVSKDHFEIGVAGTQGSVRDLGSSHGTLINGQKAPLEWKALSAGDEVRVGLTVMRILSDGPADADARCFGPIPASQTGSASMASAAGATGAGTGAASTAGNTTARTAAPSPAPKGLPPDALVGTTLAGYKILQKVGAGGMGSVYRAEQLSLHREVALKVLAEKLVSDSAFVDQFVNEARAAGQLNHPNVVQVYDVGHADGRHFFSMEFIHGGSLEGKIPKTGGGVKWESALPWFLDAANALIFAEKKGILHRDIKPDNFMIGQDGSVKLCDLGLAKKSESADLLAQGIIGTPHFIAPEAVRRKTEVDRRADLYSLGCTFFRLLTGKNPYPAASVKEILLAHLNAPVPRVSAVAPPASVVPKEVDDVIVRLMQKDPAARYQGAAELWAALDKIRLQHGMEAHGLHPGRAKKIAIAGGLLGAAAIGVVLWTEPWKDRTPEKETVVVDHTDRTAAGKAREATAKSHFADLRVAAAGLGRLEDGEVWKNKAWEEVVRKYEAMASSAEFKDTEAARDAAAEAVGIRKYREQRQKVADADAKAAAAATAELATVVEEGLKKAHGLEGPNRPVEGERVLEETRTAAKAVAKRAGTDGSPLVAKDDVTAKLQSIDDALAGFEKTVRDDLDAADAKAKPLIATGSSVDLDAAVQVFTQFVTDHPEAAPLGAVSRAWNDARRTAEAAGKSLRGRQDQARRKDLVADKGDYFSWLVKDAYLPRAEDGGAGAGKLASFHFAEAADTATARAKGAKTPEYRALLERRANELRLVASLPGVLASGFASKGWKDKVVGTGWSGVPKAVQADGLLVADKAHPYADEGLGWFYDLFYVGGAERYPLDANAHEALAYVAESAGILEVAGSAARFDQAVAELRKAAEADPKRAERLAARTRIAEDERAAKSMLDDSWGLVEGVKNEIRDLQADIDGSDAKKADAARKKVLETEQDMQSRLVRARKLLDDAESKWPSTVSRALLVDSAPDATYAGETVPPPPDPSPVQPHTGPGKGPEPTPGMGADPAPGMGTGPEPGMGAEPTPGMSPDPTPSMADDPPPGMGTESGPQGPPPPGGVPPPPVPPSQPPAPPLPPAPPSMGEPPPPGMAPDPTPSEAPVPVPEKPPTKNPEKP